MNIQTVATGIVSLLIAVIVIALVAVPVVDDATTGTKYTGTNTQIDSTYSFLESSPTFSWERTSAAKMNLTINGTTSEVPYGNSTEVTIATDKFALRAISSGAQMWDYTESTYTVSNSGSIVISLAVNNGSYSLTFDGTTTTGTISWALVKDPAGEWGLFTSPFRATVGQEVLVGHLYQQTYGPLNIARATDGVTTGYLVDPYLFNGGEIIADDREMTYTIGYETQGEGQVVGHYSSMNFDWGTTSSDNFRAWAPLDYESTPSTEGGGTNAVLLALIPLLLIIVAVMVAVRLLIKS